MRLGLTFVFKLSWAIKNRTCNKLLKMIGNERVDFSVNFPAFIEFLFSSGVVLHIAFIFVLIHFPEHPLLSIFKWLETVLFFNS